ncbi:hypothetical protein WMY93_002092 [Mugilogobius chulae]|uniref:Uncharacterized protein n=1 Tax=Mugilogobius chulae TaxID=88201 RepID=A0AAW0Q7Q2_9GOBI
MSPPLLHLASSSQSSEAIPHSSIALGSRACNSGIPYPVSSIQAANHLRIGSKLRSQPSALSMSSHAIAPLIGNLTSSTYAATQGISSPALQQLWSWSSSAYSLPDVCSLFALLRLPPPLVPPQPLLPLLRGPLQPMQASHQPPTSGSSHQPPMSG